MTTSTDQLSRLEIPGDKKSRRKRGPVLIIGLVALVVVVGLIVLASTRKSDNASPNKPPKVAATPPSPPKPTDAVLTVSGYVIPRERIEISPKFQGTVEWIGVKKGDAVKKGE